MQLEIVNPPSQIKIAMSLIETIKKKNKFTYDLRLQLDYHLKDAGLYNPNEPDVLKINPWICDENPSSYVYIEDSTIFGIIMHEFSHFLSMTYFVDFQKNYLEAFPENRFIITKYDAANEDYDEEIAEIMSLYIRNPYLLKLISEPHYRFLKSWFLSPVPCTVTRFIYMYNKMSIEYKNKLRMKWGIMVNHAEKTAYTVPSIKPKIEGIIMKP
jgi:hypothetical protein